MKRSLIAALTAIIMAITISPAFAGHHRKSFSPVTNAEYKALQVGWSKYQIQQYLDNDGHRSLSWTEPSGPWAGAWIQKRYVGALIPDQWEGTETRVYINYRLEGDKYVAHYMTRCVWNGFDFWTCGQQKTDQT